MMKVRGVRPIAFTAFGCLGTLMKHDARVFEVASQSRLRNKRNGNIHDFFSHVVGKFVITKNCIVMAICLFRGGVNNVITILWIIIKSRFNFEFFILLCYGDIGRTLTLS